MLLILLALTTAFLESPIAAFLLGKRDGYLYLLLLSALANLLTNLLLNGVFLPVLGRTSLGWVWNGWLILLLGELILAWLGEGLLYRLLAKGVSFGRGMLVSALGNTVSLGLGLGLWAVWGGTERELTFGFALLCGIAGVIWFICLARGIRHEKNR